MVIGSYFRLFVSVGFLGLMDEQYWVAAAALSSLGGIPYYNDLHIQQTSSLLYEPLVYLYYKLFGSTGVILFVRHLYFALALGCAWIYFRFFRRFTDLVTALAIASLLIVSTWWAQPSLGYNSIGGLCFGCGALLAVRGVDERNWKWLGGSGIFFFFSLAAYPTLLGALVALWAAIAILRFKQKKSWVREMLFANGITILFLGAFLLSLILRTSVKDLINVYEFSTAHSSLGSFTGKLSYGIWLWYKFLPPWWGLAPFFGLWFYLWRKFDVPWQLFAVPFALMMWIQEPPEAGTFHPPMVMLLTVSGIPLVVEATRRSLKDNWSFVALLCAALAGTLLTCWSSALTIYTTFVTSTYALAVVFLYASRSRHYTPWVALSTLLIPLIIFFHKNVFNQRDDAAVTSQVELLTTGPYAGLLTSPQRAEFLNQLQADIDATTQGARSIIFYDEFPMGYLMTPLFPATRTLWMHTLRESYNVKGYIRASYFDSANRPDVIFRFNYFPVDGKKMSVTPDQFKPAEDVFWDYLPREAEYSRILEREAYSVFRRRVPVP